MEIYTAETKPLKKMESEDGRTKKVGFNARVIGRRLASGVYKNEISGPRELIANGVTSIEAAIEKGYLSRTEALISIKFHEDGRLEISDNGTGISRDVLDKVLSVMGNSTNFDKSRSGQMGMGFFAFLTVSSVAFVHTMTHDGKSFSAICRDAQVFDIFENSQRTERGTTIILQLYDGGEDDEGNKLPMVDRSNIIQLCKSIGMATKVPMVIDTMDLRKADNDDDDEDDDDDNNSDYGIFKYDGTGLRHLETEYDEPILYITSDDIEIAVTVGDSVQNYLCGMPIQINSLPSFVTVNIIDERRYIPMPDRERLTAEAESEVIKNVKNALRRELKGFWGIKNHDTLVNSPMRDIFRAFVINPLASNILGWAGVSFKCRKIFTTPLFKHDIDIVEDCSMIEILHKYQRPAFSTTRRNSIIRGIDAIKSDIHMIWTSVENKSAAIKCIKAWGIPYVKDELKKDKIRMKDLANANIKKRSVNARCHKHEFRYETTSLESMDKDATIVMAGKDQISDLMPIIKKHRGSTVFIRYYKEPIGDPRIVSYKDWMDGMLEKEYETTKGKIKLKDLVKQKFYHSGVWEHGNWLLANFKDLFVFNYHIDDLDRAMIENRLNIKFDAVYLTSTKVMSICYGVYVSADSVTEARKYFAGLNQVERRIMMNYAGHVNYLEEVDKHERMLDIQKALAQSTGPVPTYEPQTYVHYLKILYSLIDERQDSYLWSSVSRACSTKSKLNDYSYTKLVSALVFNARMGTDDFVLRKIKSKNLIQFKAKTTSTEISLKPAPLGQFEARFRNVRCRIKDGKLCVDGYINII